jgi:hypothetical protein
MAIPCIFPLSIAMAQNGGTLSIHVISLCVVLVVLSSLWWCNFTINFWLCFPIGDTSCLHRTHKVTCRYFVKIELKVLKNA